MSFFDRDSKEFHYIMCLVTLAVGLYQFWRAYKRRDNFSNLLRWLVVVLVPCLILYLCSPPRHHDTTSKNAVLAETEQIKNYIGKEIFVEYLNQDKITIFNSEIFINSNHKESIEKYQEYLRKNGYKKIDDNLWLKMNMQLGFFIKENIQFSIYGI